VVALAVEDGAGGACSVNGQGGTDKLTTGLALNVLGGPDAKDRADREVALDD